MACMMYAFVSPWEVSFILVISKLLKSYTKTVAEMVNPSNAEDTLSKAKERKDFDKRLDPGMLLFLGYLLLSIL